MITTSCKVGLESRRNFANGPKYVCRSVEYHVGSTCTGVRGAYKKLQV